MAIAAKLKIGLVEKIVGLADAAGKLLGTIGWSQVTDKPTTFAPTIGTTATTAMAGNTALPYTCLVSVVANSTNVQIYSSRGIPAGIWMGVNCDYIIAQSGEGNVTFTGNGNITGATMRGGTDASRYSGFVTGYFQTAVAIPAATWTTIGTVNLGANGNRCYSIGVQY